MKRYQLTLGLAFLCGLLCPASHAEPDGCNVMVRVISSATNQPVPSASVFAAPATRLTVQPGHSSMRVLASDGGDPTGLRLSTNAQGIVCLPESLSGHVALRAVKQGFSSSVERVLQFVSAVPPSQSRSSSQTVTIKLMPLASLTGSVTGDDEDIPDGTQAQLLMQVPMNNRLAWVPVKATALDETGGFKLNGVAPGRFLLCVQPPLARHDLPRSSTPNAGQRPTYVRTCFQASPNVSAALLIEMLDGNSRENIRVELLKAPIYSVSGRFVGDYATEILSVTLLPEGEETPGIGLGSGVIDEKKTFSFHGLGSGSYVIQVLSLVRGIVVPYREQITVATSNIEDHSIQLPNSASVEISLVQSIPSLIESEDFELSLVSSATLFGPVCRASRVRSTAMKIDGCGSTTPYSVRLSGNPPLQVKSAILNGRSVDPSDFSLSAGINSLELEVELADGRVEGVGKVPVRLSADIFSLPSIVLVGMTDNLPTIRTWPDDSGRFVFDKLPYGRYRLFSDFELDAQTAITRALNPEGHGGVDLLVTGKSAVIVKISE